MVYTLMLQEISYAVIERYDILESLQEFYK
jgi:hypothetical protein